MNGISFKRLDWAMLGTILMLIGLSAAFIYSAQFKSEVDVGGDYRKQLGFAAIGICAYGALVWYDYKHLATVSWWIYGGAIFLLLIVFLFAKVNGSHRWIPLPGFTQEELDTYQVFWALASGLRPRTQWLCPSASVSSMNLHPGKKMQRVSS